MEQKSERISEALKESLRTVGLIVLAGVIIEIAVFAVLHMIKPEQIPFGYTVILAAIGGGAVAVLNFFLLGLAVQKAASDEEDDTARRRMKLSYSRRMLLQILWVILAVALPCFQFVAGIIPLLFPSTGIKLMGMIKRK